MQDAPSLLKTVLQKSSIKKAIKLLIDHASEIKHEDTICTLLSAELRSKGPASISRRKVYFPKLGRKKARCIDLVINTHKIEAKYHFEGDLVHIEKVFVEGARYKKKGSRTARKEVRDELRRDAPAYFLWMVCVRSEVERERKEIPYKMDNLIGLFYKNKMRGRGKTLGKATKVAEAMIDKQLLRHFRRDVKTRRIRSIPLPTIRGGHSSLIFRLYHLAKSDMGPGAAT